MKLSTDIVNFREIEPPPEVEGQRLLLIPAGWEIEEKENFPIDWVEVPELKIPLIINFAHFISCEATT